MAEGEQEKYTAEFSLGNFVRTLTWTRIAKEGVKTDARTDARFKPVIKRSSNEYDTPFNTWKNICVPGAWLKRLEKFSNHRLDGQTHRTRKTTETEWLRFFLYMGALALSKGVPLEKAWKASPEEGSICPALDIGRFGMSKKRFKKLRSLAGKAFDKDEADMDENDPQRYYSFWAEEWNAHMEEVMTPGWLLSPDESMCAYTGVEGVDSVKFTSTYTNIDHLDFVPRKPEPLGKECKTMCDGESGAFIRLEIQQGAAHHHRQEWYDSWGHTTAQCLRLVKPWLYSERERVFAADSWFSGVRTSEALCTLSGGKMFTVGDVKTNSSGFPKQSFMAAVPEGNGQWATFSSTLGELDHPTIKEMKMWAVAHRRGGAVHCFIFTAGTTLMGQPMKHSIKEDNDGGSDYIIARECPKVLNDFTKAQPATDAGNRNRQHMLAMEKRFVTKSFPFRFFTFMLGITFVNAEALCKYFHREVHKRKTFLDLVHEVCEDGLNELFPFKRKRNEDVEKDRSSNSDSEDGDRGNSANLEPGAPSPVHIRAASQSQAKHLLAPLSKHKWEGGRQIDCGECGRRCGFFCVTCSTEESVIALHPERIGNRKFICWEKHKRNPDRSRRARARGSRPKK